MRSFGDLNLVGERLRDLRRSHAADRGIVVNANDGESALCNQPWFGIAGLSNVELVTNLAVPLFAHY